MLRNMMVVCAILLTTTVSAHALTQDAHPPIRVGGNVQAAKIIKQAQPVYPELARKAGVSGTVVLHVVIGKDGTVQRLNFVSGPPLLMKSAMDCVRQWMYQPTLLNGEPVEVDTTVSVVYELGQSGDTSDQDSEGQPVTQIDPQLKADLADLIEVLHLTDIMTQVLKTNIEPLE